MMSISDIRTNGHVLVRTGNAYSLFVSKVASFIFGPNFFLLIHYES